MLFTETQLKPNPFSILNEAIYLTEEESRTYINMIPIMQLSSGNIVPYHYLEQFCYEQGVGIQEGIALISDTNDIDKSSITVAIDESDLILNPNLISIHESIVVKPESIYSDESNFVLEALDFWAENNYNDDILLLEIAISSTMRYHKEFHPKDFSTSLKILGVNSRAKQFTMERNDGSEIKSLEKIDDRVASNINRVAKSESYIEALVKLCNLGGIHYNGTETYDKLADMILKNKNKIISANNTKHQYHPNRLNRLLSMIQSANFLSSGKDHKDGSFKIERVTSKFGDKFKDWGKDKDEDKKEKKTDEPKTSNPIFSNNNPSPSIIKTRIGLGKKLAIGAGIGTAIGAGIYAVNQYRNQPRSVIAKRIAALRSIYSRWLQKAQNAPNEGLKNKFKLAAAKILGVIDKLMAFIQRKADGRN